MNRRVTEGKTGQDRTRRRSVASDARGNVLLFVDGVDAELRQTLQEDVLSKKSAPSKSDAPLITPIYLAEADRFVVGFPTKFGMMAAQFKAFVDATGGLWRTQQLAGKPAGIFYSTGSQGGGQETTIASVFTCVVTDSSTIFFCNLCKQE
ncbi:unnamed protein product [Eruca vesicaria subsp. sativa]|uniref:NAD(P)H dehydrogenase (quinone) n=1 Tax=Eruca vesicaria subsp. sativa TaxID=29727 RepID=A0ABC8L5Q1_ERUVS|nr:unnamed protein product [Eruca vesicaria subsp. sativa]